MNPSREVNIIKNNSIPVRHETVVKKNKNRFFSEEETTSIGEVDIIKSFQESRGRPLSSSITDADRSAKYPETKRRYRSKNREMLIKNKREYDKRHREQFNQYHLIVNIVKELINQQKLSVPQELLQLIQAV